MRVRKAPKELKKRKISEEVEFYARKEEALTKKHKLSPAFLRPPYQYTAIENKTIERIHEDDWMK